jgi:hypothetical protein
MTGVEPSHASDKDYPPEESFFSNMLEEILDIRNVQKALK